MPEGGEEEKVEQRLVAVAVLAVCPQETDFLTSPAPARAEPSAPPLVLLLPFRSVVPCSIRCCNKRETEHLGLFGFFFPPVNSE